MQISKLMYRLTDLATISRKMYLNMNFRTSTEITTTSGETSHDGLWGSNLTPGPGGQIVYSQPDQINMNVFFWYLVKRDASVRYCTVAYTGQVTFYKVPETHSHVYLVTLYMHLFKVRIAIVVYIIHTAWPH